MTNQAPDLLEKLRQQYDKTPYPNTPLDTPANAFPHLLYIHNLVTPYYLRNQKVIDTKDKIILDAGCGTGYKSLVLAETNPGAKIVGIDISAESIKLAKQRLDYYGFDNAEFHVLSLEELTKLNYKFDYINCDEILYLIPDISVGLKAMQEVLSPSGIIRANLHSFYQRLPFLRAQKVFQIMGLMDGVAEDLEVEIVVDTMKALKDDLLFKANAWNAHYETEDTKEKILVNHLLQGDKGFTITDIFTALRASNLEFISMVNWREWNLLHLFKEPDNLPVFLAMSLPEISTEEELQIYELINPKNRLLDFWCGHPEQGQTFVPVPNWTDADWRNAKVYLHPQFNIPKFKEDLKNCITENKVFTLEKKSPTTGKPIILDMTMTSCLVPLLEQPQSFTSIVERWQKVRPVDPVTLQATDPEKAFQTVKDLFTILEIGGYIMLEKQS